ncbi:MAG: hypothetical protein HY817_05030 [Candidatus Abawacabacteria bacterium]|nr:hypothetical protein [Candidatus Abawacabacteria bacterium]
MKSFFLTLSIVLIATTTLAACANKEIPNATLNTQTSIYCSSDGSFTAIKPIQSHRSYCLQSDAKGKVYTANQASSYTFAIRDDQGTVVKDFAITHTKPMHVIVVRKDLNYFQHLHPEFNQSTGTFTLSNLAFPTEGQYRIFADFAVTGGQMDPMNMPLGITSFEDVQVGNNYHPQAIGAEEKVKTFEGYQVSLDTGTPLQSSKEAKLAFDLKQNGKSVTDLQEYLGALGHTVILREGTLDFIHAHPVESINQQQSGKVNFMVHFPEAGKYKIFTQFQRAGKVVTTDFVVSVAQGEEDSGMIDMGTKMPGMNHSMMRY